MRETKKRLRAPRAVVLGLVLVAGAGREAAAQLVTWELFDRDKEPAEQNDKRVTCGRYGVFHLKVENPVPGAGSIEPYPPRNKGIEVPARFPSYADAAAPVPPAGSLSTAADAWFPCDEGGCFASPFSFSPGQPWVAVIDWDSPHGWSVGWTIRQVTGPSVGLALFPLADPELESVYRRGETDAHLLAQLCRLTELVEHHGLTPPVAVNMSFGRLARSEDKLPAGICNPDRLACQVAFVVEHLRQISRPELPAPGTVFVAAAGNHGQLLYPAAAPAVVAAGAIDLAVFWANRGAVPSWETPHLTGQAAALMPGYGICLFPGPAPQDQRGHPVPPGSSYAAATFSGFLVAPLLAGELGDPLLPVLWQPVATCTSQGCSYQVLHGERPMLGVGPGLDLLLEQTRTGRPRCRPPHEGTVQANGLLGAGLAASQSIPRLSFDDVAAADRKQPAPGADPCVPCRGHNPPPPLNVWAVRGLATHATLASLVGLELDLSFAGALPGDYTLLGLFLRVGETFYPVSVSGGLGRLQSGAVDRLVVPDTGSLVLRGEQPSLVFVLRDDLESGAEFWTSIPILMQ